MSYDYNRTTTMDHIQNCLWDVDPCGHEDMDATTTAINNLTATLPHFPETTRRAVGSYLDNLMSDNLESVELGENDHDFNLTNLWNRIAADVAKHNAAAYVFWDKKVEREWKAYMAEVKALLCPHKRTPGPAPTDSDIPF